MKYSSIPLAQTVSALCKAKGIEHIIISPGSRNAPLTISFTEDPYFKTYSIVDERSAAFFALGIAQQLKKPTAVLCTSGSALLNYYPAISEAFYSDIPLVVLSADRPSYKIDIGDGQTIRQDNVYERHILYSANLKQDLREEDMAISGDGKNKPLMEAQIGPVKLQQAIQKENEEEINKALNIAFEESGPVHLNIPFEEPLYHKTGTQFVFPENNMPKIKREKLSAEVLNPYVDIWNKAQRKMILVGVNAPDCVEKVFLEQLAQDPSVLVFTETTSNLHHSNFFPNIDKIIAPIEKLENAHEFFRELQPEVLLTFGGMVVSKKIKAFLRKYRPKHHWHIDAKKAYNTYYCLERHFKTTPNLFFQDFLKEVTPVKSDFQTKWLKIKAKRSNAHKEYITQIPFSDFKVYERVLKTIPENYQLQLSNSSTIRYAQLFQLHEKLQVFCNRGTSGIDGSSSTAVGAASATNNPTILITGDLSFFYDSNALWNNYIRPDFRIIVINNGGGGIFRILPGDKNSENFDNYFETTHNLNAKGLCSTYGFEYKSVDCETDLESSIKHLYKKSSKPCLLEIFTPRKMNDEILLNYFTFLSKN
ncbi:MULTISPECIES: 2-succinyl-5-enolpyruvyl-6-hydroxy-3-cyclohexene-1-carboxylate synthase [Galbibacter]|uniref:2-succinyl-5-enolpyruvyl-6-hydroxy-3-cyclohexene-1-carboxylate synthase n=1 Tax=Galbibacter pacificus TaxID=2996052 RepID=A0ABT6FQL3_9FLAO|nr:2-succinyl-5-enolpyruvyl-6-hydroxy-3-cyclohexene-1-carboxylate synthase [Galbibacter pacificus]MDG3581969.1 thiamine pyrophosphate-binding protein [Galbibacter pacificus]MDG3585557.1 thiamine pyrophosphate-binding protein [Galbibacter pacificus]